MESREVAEIVGKAHNELLKDIRRYVKQLGQGNIPQSDFFTESTYQNSQNKTMPCYMVTKKGCEFIAHKLTGIKGTKFTATYINRFHEMEDRLRGSSGYVPIELVEQIVKKQVESALAQHGSGQGNGMIYQRSSQYDYADGYTIEIRKKEFYASTMKAADMFGVTHSGILHQLYKALERRFGIVLDAYKSVYRSETGRQDASIAEVIAANDRLYNAAMELNEYAISSPTG